MLLWAFGARVRCGAHELLGKVRGLANLFLQVPLFRCQERLTVAFWVEGMRSGGFRLEALGLRR